MGKTYNRTELGAWYRHGDLADEAGSYPALEDAPTADDDGISIPQDEAGLHVLLSISHAADAARAFSVEVYIYRPEVRILVDEIVSSIEAAEGWAKLDSFDFSESADGVEIRGLSLPTAATRIAARVTGATGEPVVLTDFSFTKGPAFSTLSHMNVQIDPGTVNVGKVDAGTGWSASGLAKEADGNLAAAVAAFGATSDASIDADAAGTLSGKLRGLLKAFLARIPVIGPQLMAASMSVTPSVNTAALVFSPDATMDETLTSAAIDTKGCSRISLQLHAASATHVGTVAVQVSDDGTNWNPVTLSSTPTAASGSAFDATIDLDIAAKQFRVVYTFTSGTGTLTGSATLKG